jgi:hypothetical protein
VKQRLLEQEVAAPAAPDEADAQSVIGAQHGARDGGGKGETGRGGGGVPEEATSIPSDAPGSGRGAGEGAQQLRMWISYHHMTLLNYAQPATPS